MKSMLTVARLLLGFCQVAALAGESNNPRQALVWPDGTRYLGGVKDGQRSGPGAMIFQDWRIFKAKFEN